MPNGSLGTARAGAQLQSAMADPASEALKLATFVADADSFADLTRRLYEGAPRLFGNTMVGFDMLDPHTHTLESTSAHGVSTFFLARYDQFARHSDPVLEQALRTREIAYNLAMMSAEQWRSLALYDDVFSMHHMLAVAYVPVIVEGEVVATLNLARSAEGSIFATDELQRASELAKLMASVMQSLRMKDELGRRVNLQELALDLVAEAIVISDVARATRYSNRAARDILARQPGHAPSLDEAVAEWLVASDPRREGMVAHSVSLEGESAFIAFLRDSSVEPRLPARLRQRLSAREADVALLVAAGLRDAEIAVRLNLSVHTVKGYLRETFRKTGVRSRVELAGLAAARDDAAG